MNFLSETMNTLTALGIGVEDVSWVGSRDGGLSISWEAFAPIADFDYTASGEDGEMIATDLVIVGTVNGEPFWISREYEVGEAEISQWWARQINDDPHPQVSPDTVGFDQLLNPPGQYLPLAEINSL